MEITTRYSIPADFNQGQRSAEGKKWGHRKGRERERERDEKGREEVGRDGGGILVLQIHAGE